MSPETKHESDFYTETESEVEIKGSDLEDYLPEVHEFSEECEEILAEKTRLSVCRKRKYVCTQGGCEETFRRKTQFDRHIFKHNGIKIHRCSFPDCGREYIISSALKRHIRTYHSKQREERIFDCPVPSCKKSFDSAWNLERHSKNRHENPTKYKCEICQSEFQRKMKLKFHIVAAHTKEYPFSCEKCGKKFITEHFFKIHHCKSYSCEICKSVFSKWSQLTEHRKTSTACLYRYKCTECSKEFKFPGLLKDHEQIHMSADKRIGFNCTFEGCDKFYTMKKNLDAHFRRKHGDQKDSFRCTFDNCGITLSTKKKLDDHIDKKHLNVNKTEPAKKAGPRNRRKDAGKRNILKELTGLDVPGDVEKAILENENDVLIEPIGEESEKDIGTN